MVISNNINYIAEDNNPNCLSMFIIKDQQNESCWNNLYFFEIFLFFRHGFSLLKRPYTKGSVIDVYSDIVVTKNSLD